MIDMYYPKAIRRMNRILERELGSNPRYSWIWTNDLHHVMEVIDKDGKPEYVEQLSPAGLYVMTPKTERRLLMPFHQERWTLCALVEVNDRDGSIHGTGSCAWVPISGANGPVTLEPNEYPTLETTNYVAAAIRQERSRSVEEVTEGWEKAQAKKEQDRWKRMYDEIRDSCTAFYNVPGRKGHVSFPSIQ